MLHGDKKYSADVQHSRIRGDIQSPVSHRAFQHSTIIHIGSRHDKASSRERL